MIVSIHQPHFLPWMGYLNKVLHSEIFIWLHTVQFRKNYFQNRTQIKNVNEQPLWLTLPVHARLAMRIDEVTIAEARWRDKVTKTIEQCYRRAPYFQTMWPVLASALEGANDRLEEVNLRLFEALIELLGAGSTRVVRAGDLPASSNDPNERLVELCKAVGATRYIAGRGGHNYLDSDQFERAGVQVVWQAFRSESVVYPQRGNNFLAGLSAIDCLFNVGADRTRELALAAWQPDEP